LSALGKLGIVFLVKYKLRASAFASVKAVPKHVDEIDTRDQCHQDVYACRSQKCNERPTA